MNTYGFTADITDEATGFIITHDVDCRIGVSVEFNEADPEITIESIELECIVAYPQNKAFDGKRQFMHILGNRDPFLNLLAQKIEKAALKSDWFISEVFEGEGIRYVGFGSNDPDGVYRMEAA